MPTGRRRAERRHDCRSCFAARPPTGHRVQLDLVPAPVSGTETYFLDKIEISTPERRDGLLQES